MENSMVAINSFSAMNIEKRLKRNFGISSRVGQKTSELFRSGKSKEVKSRLLILEPQPTIDWAFQPFKPKKCTLQNERETENAQIEVRKKCTNDNYDIIFKLKNCHHYVCTNSDKFPDWSKSIDCYAELELLMLN